MAGNLYGTTLYGGAFQQGVVYKLSPTGQETVLHAFSGGQDGANPYSVVVQDPAGNLYGTTTYGGKSNAGIVFKISPGGQESVLYTFSGYVDGVNPQAGVILDPAGNLYGTTTAGGTGGYGVVYKLDTAGVETVLHTFGGGTDGTLPISGVIRDPSGNLYGTTYGGGAGGQGIVYEIKQN